MVLLQPKIWCKKIVQCRIYYRCIDTIIFIVESTRERRASSRGMEREETKSLGVGII
jgi:hypothetical protein